MRFIIKNNLNSNQIKFIAILAMTIDHITWVLFPGYSRVWWVIALHIIGRLTAPIMWFFIAEGFYYTKDVRKYILRLFIFALISHFPYLFAGGLSYIPNGFFNQTSVMWPLSWAVVLMVIFKTEKLKLFLKIILIIIICFITFPSDWSTIAAICPVYLYLNRENFKKQAIMMFLWVSIYSIVYIIFLDKLYGSIQMLTLFSLILLKKYNGTLGKWKGMKWFFYIYYPLHLIIIGIIRISLGKGKIFP